MVEAPGVFIFGVVTVYMIRAAAALACEVLIVSLIVAQTTLRMASLGARLLMEIGTSIAEEPRCLWLYNMRKEVRTEY